MKCVNSLVDAVGESVYAKDKMPTNTYMYNSWKWLLPPDCFVLQRMAERFCGSPNTQDE